MRILYAIQGTGNGHLSRAIEIIPHFSRRAEVDVLLSGTQCQLELPFPVRYRFHGLSFVFGKRGGIDLYGTYATNRFRRFLREVNSLVVNDYNLVISDFEPISAWACQLAAKKCIGLSNQAALLTGNVPMAESIDPVGRFILAHYAPVSQAYGFHFQRYNPSINTPLIRREVRMTKVTDLGHHTVYLPAHDVDTVIDILSGLGQTRWDVFSKSARVVCEHGNVRINPISGEAFLRSMASSSGVLCAAGFGTASEALFLRKKLCVIPMKGQFEQQCNAVALAEMGVHVLSSLKPKQVPNLENWIGDRSYIRVNYPDNADLLVSRIISEHLLAQASPQEKKALIGIAV